MGRNCRFLQGPATDQEEVVKIRKALSAEPPQAVTVTLVNYRRDGSPFFNCLHVAPIRDAKGKVGIVSEQTGGGILNSMQWWYISTAAAQSVM